MAVIPALHAAPNQRPHRIVPFGAEVGASSEEHLIHVPMQ